MSFLSETYTDFVVDHVHPFMFAIFPGEFIKPFRSGAKLGAETVVCSWIAVNRILCN